MRYFGISKRVKVSHKLEPRDFDRSKLFAEVTPVIHKNTYVIICWTGLATDILHTIKCNMGIDVLKTDYTGLFTYKLIYIKASNIEASIVNSILGVIEVKEIK